MPDNTEWQRRVDGMLTDRGCVREAMKDGKKFKAMMQRYRSVAEGYLIWLLDRHKLVPDQASAAAAMTRIWREILEEMPEKLAKKWETRGVTFRSLLCECIHEACLAWQRMASFKPSMPGLAVPGSAENEEFLRSQRRYLLERANDRLRNYQEERNGGKTPYFIVFCLKDEHRQINGRPEGDAELLARFEALTGDTSLTLENLRKILSRSRDKYGLYLFEELAPLIATNGPPDVDRYRHAFEELDLMDDYAMKSQQCRMMLGLEDD